MKRIIDFLISELGRIVLGAVLFVSAIVFQYAGLKIPALMIYIAALTASGAPVFIAAARGILRRDLLDEKFLMSIASVGAMIVGEWSEGVAVMLFFLVGEYFEHKAVNKSRKSIKALMDIRPDEASMLVDGVETVVDADDVEPGSEIVIRAGERIPIDSVVISGSADIDTSSLTGESIPVSVSENDEIYAGAVLISGYIIAKTIKAADESRAARVLELVENANEKKSKTENFITKFSHFYTPIVVGLAILLAIIPPLFKIRSVGDSIYSALIFLVISCPCALVISVPMAFFGGIGGAASKGILFKGGNTFSALAKADTFVFDKTGTLTSGSFNVSSVSPYAVTEEELLYYSASAEYGSNHPIAACIKNSTENKTVPASTKEMPGRGVFAIVDGFEILVGNRKLLCEEGVDFDFSKAPSGAVFVSKNGVFIGYLEIADTVRCEAGKSIEMLRKSGAENISILSGDKRENVARVASEIGINDINYELLPEEKYQKLQKMIDLSKGTVYVGDGINDAPAIAAADVGVAMGSIGQDAAIESADLVIMSDNLSKISEAVKIARKTVKIAYENIIFALGIKGTILVLGALGIANMWLAVFADVGVAALAILNSMRTLRVK